MLGAIRKDKIKTYILEKKTVTVSELAAMFRVSEETIRRDLKALELEGVLIRTHGGAFLQKRVQHGTSYAMLESIFVENKQMIARKARELIVNGDSIFLDCSTTALHICYELTRMHLTVLTNSLKVSSKLSESEDLRVISAGGQLQRSTMSFVGRTAVDALKGYFVDKAFVSCTSVSMENGITDNNEQQAEIRQLIIEHANQVYLIADHTKFDRASFIRIAGFEHITGLIVDKRLPPEWHAFLKQNKIALYECGG